MLHKTGLLALSALFSVSAASAVDFDRGPAGIKEKLAAVPVPAVTPAPAQARALKEWTIMVFINGKNNLEPYALKDMNEMEQVGSTDKLNIVVEAGRMEGYTSADGDWKGTRRYYITKDNDTEKLSSTLVQDLGRTDMGDYKSVAAFGKWAKAAYPARKYMLIVWNHGSGWEKSSRSGIAKGISYDDETNHHINTPQLGLALKSIGKIDVYGSDACLMQMPEVDYELKDSVDYVVGSEETEPGDGYTYNTFLAPVAANPGMTPAELARTAVDAYSDHYQEQKTGSTQSYVKTAALPGLAARLDAWTAAVMAAGLKTEVYNARSLALSYAIAENKDLYHFVSLVNDRTQDAAVKAASAALLEYIARDLVGYSRYNDQPASGGGGGWEDDDWDKQAGAKSARSYGKAYSDSHGIAIYVPGSAAGAAYAELAWAAASKWDEFLAWASK